MTYLSSFLVETFLCSTDCCPKNPFYEFSVISTSYCKALIKVGLPLSHTSHCCTDCCHPASFSMLSIFLFLSLMSRAMCFMVSSAPCRAWWSGWFVLVYLRSSASCRGYLHIFCTGMSRKPSNGISIMSCRSRHASKKCWYLGRSCKASSSSQARGWLLQ